MLHTTVHVFTYERYRIGQDKKNAILITHYTPYDKERLGFYSYTSHTQWLATMTAIESDG
jgi:hypothetical protein